MRFSTPTALLRTWLGWMAMAGLLALVSLFHAPAAAQAVTTVGNAPEYLLGPGVQMLEDPGRSLVLEQVLQADTQQRFTPLASHGNASNFGLTQSAIWLRIHLQTQASTPAAWLLEVAFPSLDQVELFTPQDGGGFLRQVAGDQLPFTDRPLSHRNHVFPLQLRPDSSSTLYLRVTSEGTLSIPLRLWQPDALAQDDHGSYTALGVYFGLLAGLVLYNLLLFISIREKLYLAYIGFAAGMGLTQLGLTGFGAEFLWPTHPQWGNATTLSSAALAGLFGLLFTRLFLDTAAQARRLDRWLQGLGWLFAITAVGTLVLPYQLTARLLNLAGILFSVSIAGTGIYSLLQRQPGAGYFLGAWLVLVVAIVVKTTHNLGWLPSHPLVVNAILIGSALEMLVLALSLADRIRISRNDASKALTRVHETEQAALETLRESERQLEGRVLERTQALEQANQQLQQNEYQLALQANHDALTGLANRKLLDDRLAVAMAHAKRNQHGFAVLMLDLDGFKLVNDEYGHGAGDTVLQSVALRLTSTVRGVDTVARVGGDEFVLILDAVNSAASMMAIARKIREALATPITLDCGHVVQIDTSIGLAIYPVDGSSAEQLLAAADRAMYATKSSHQEAAASQR